LVARKGISPTANASNFGIRREDDVKHEFDQQIIDLYDNFTHGGISRRDFLDRLGSLAGSTAAATAMLPLLQNNYAQAAIVAENNPKLVTERASYDSPKGKINGYLARAKAKGKRPAVLVIHENRGLNPHLEDVARRLAVEGFLAYAVDLLSLVGGTPPNEDEARQLHTKMNQNDAVAALVAGVSFLKKHAESTGKVGAVGFCFGGGMVNRLATASPELDAGVAYYGVQVPAAQVSNIKAALLLHYAENDARVNAGIAAYEEALKANGKKYTKYVYPGTQHAFNNDLGAARYNKTAADLAWQRTLAFFKEHLGAPPHAG
jgi:carboxymethylenebutenolidase